jgi:hypothetical protein
VSSAQQPEQSAQSTVGETPGTGTGTGSTDSGSTGTGSTGTGRTETSVTLRRSPRYVNFMILGAVLGVVAALILTVTFPANTEFEPGQVFGFLLLAGVAAGVALGAIAAIVIDRVISRSAQTVVVGRLNEHGSSDAGAPDAPSDSPQKDSPHDSTHDSELQ